MDAQDLQLDLSVVAEGVEAKDQFSFLQDNRCDIYQGFYFSKPITDDELQAFYHSKPLTDDEFQGTT